MSTTVAEPLLQPDEVRNLFQTGRTPGRPVIHDHPLATELGQGTLLAFEVRQGEIDRLRRRDSGGKQAAQQHDKTHYPLLKHDRESILQITDNPPAWRFLATRRLERRTGKPLACAPDRDRQ